MVSEMVLFLLKKSSLESNFCRCITWEIVMRNFHTLLTGQVKEWYWIHIRSNRTSDWSSLRHALLYEYQSITSDFEVMRDIVERRQQPNESVDYARDL